MFIFIIAIRMIVINLTTNDLNGKMIDKERK